MTTVDHVNYSVLDQVKLACIEASKKTLNFASRYGHIINKSLGASANCFSLNTAKFPNEMTLSLIPEGLGTADDAHPLDWTAEEELVFWKNIAFKTLSCISNDAASSGLQTILVGLYLPTSTPETVFTNSFLKGFLEGFIEACAVVGCVYASGETPQLKTKIQADKIDIAGSGFSIKPDFVGTVSEAGVQNNDFIVLVESSGPHENGFTTLRSLASKLPAGYRTKLPSGVEYWKAANVASKLYTPLVMKILEEGISPTGIEHITGHGWQKIMRSSKSLEYHIEQNLPILEIFNFVQEKLSISSQELFSIFNCGTGLALFFSNLKDAERAVAIANECSINALVAGQVKSSNARKVLIKKEKVTLDGKEFVLGS
jgi:phosphoribosylformylglycinamidine cyclo-ligase